MNKLSIAYFGERRDIGRVTRADMAQGWTRYIQDLAAPVRREAEVAIGDWMVKGADREIRCDLRK